MHSGNLAFLLWNVISGFNVLWILFLHLQRHPLIYWQLYAYILQIIVTSVDVVRELFRESTITCFGCLSRPFQLLSSPLLSFFLRLSQTVDLTTTKAFFLSLFSKNHQIFGGSFSSLSLMIASFTCLEIFLDFILVAPFKQLTNANSLPDTNSRLLFCLLHFLVTYWGKRLHWTGLSVFFFFFFFFGTDATMTLHSKSALLTLIWLAGLWIEHS